MVLLSSITNKTPTADGAATSDGAVSKETEHVARRWKRRRARLVRTIVIGVVALALLGVAIVVAVVDSPSDSTRRATGSGAPRTTAPRSVPNVAPLGTSGERLFSPTSFWNTPIPADAAIAADSGPLVDAFNSQWRKHYGTVSVNTDEYGVPIYRVAEDQPTVPVSIADGCHPDAGLVAQFSAVPIPPDASPATGSDHAMIVWQPGTDTVWELWRASNTAGAWSACWGGQIQHVSESDGVFPSPYGMAATGLSYLAGTIKVSELEAGHIDHALAIALVHTTAGTQVPPANRNDGDSTAEDAIPEGTRFRLDPSIDVTALGLTRSGVTIARALQTYGMVVSDKAGAVVFAAEDGTAYVREGTPNPYVRLLQGRAPFQVLDGIPWDRLQVIPPGS